MRAAKAAEDARRAAEAKAAEDARRAAEAKAAEDARRAAEEESRQQRWGLPRSQRRWRLHGDRATTGGRGNRLAGAASYD